MPYPNFPMSGFTRDSRSYYGVVAYLPNGEEREVGEWIGDPEAAGTAALSAYARYYRTARVEVLCDGANFAYVAVNPRVPRGTPFLCEAGFCAHHECGEIAPDECFCVS